MQDAHTHFIPSNMIKWLKDYQNFLEVKWEKRTPEKEEFLNVGGKWAFELKDTFIDSELYLQEQSTAGVSHSLVSPIPQLFLYDYPTKITIEASTVYNQSLAEWVNHNNQRLSGVATVPLNHPEQAAIELVKAMNLGLKGAIIGPGCSGHMLTDSFFTPFWEEANRQSAIIFIHPLLNQDPRLKRRKMPNLIGVPWETTLCAADILLSGMLDQYSKVKILLAHGGGFLPYQIGRLNKGYEQWSEIAEGLQNRPSEYLRRFWYDTVLWDKKSLNYLNKVVGEERIVPGSDFPFDLSAWPPSTENSKGWNSLFGK